MERNTQIKILGISSENRIMGQKACINTAQQNEIAERNIRHLLKVVSSLSLLMFHNFFGGK